MIDFEIATYWNVETLYYVLNGVASIMAGEGFAGLLKMVFLFALLLGVFALAFSNKQAEFFTWFIQALIFTTLLNMPIARVLLTDKTDLEPPRVIDNVPFSLAVVAQTTNLAFGWATHTYETVFGVPDDLGLAKGDLAFGHRILKNVNNVIIREPGLRSDLMQFFKECTLYDIRDGVITPDQIVGQTDTWNTVFSNTSPARFVTYNTLTATPTTDTCTNTAAVLKGRVNAGIDAAQTFYGRQAFTRVGTDAVAKSMFATSIGSSYDWILASSASASDAMKQAMFNNIWRDAGSELPALMSDPTRIQELQHMAGAAQAARQADGSNATLSMLGQETLPHMRNWLEAILYAMFPVMVVLMVVVSAEGAKRLIGGYMMLLAWIGMWPVMFAVINHLSLLHLRHKMAALSLANGVPFQLSDVFDATLGDEQAAIGYLVILVPIISGMIIKMSQQGFMSVASMMVSGFSSAGASVGSSMASGNLSMGQVGLDTASVNSTSMHKYDSNVGLTGGGSSIGYAGGSTGIMAPNGTAALQQYQNHMITSASADHRFQSDSARESHATAITSSGQQASYRHGDSATLTNVTGHDTTRGAFQNTGVNAGVGMSGQEHGSHGTGQSLNRQYSDRSTFGASTGASDSGYMGANLSGNVGWNGGGGGSGVGGNPINPSSPGDGRMQADEKRIADGMKKGGASKSEIDNALSNYRGGQSGAQSGSGLTSGAGVGGTVGFTSQKNYQASHGRDRSEGDSHSVDENARIERGYSISGQRAVTAGTGDQSAQTDRSGRDASRSNVDERSTVKDVSDRSERGIGTRASTSESRSFAIQRNMMADPHYLAKVAERNGLNANRFLGQEEGRISKMINDYAAEREAMTGATAMPNTSFDGNRLPANTGDLAATSDRNVRDLPNDIGDRYRSKSAQTGFTGTGPVAADTAMPVIVPATEHEVRSHLNPNATGSIPNRAAALDENTHAWASHDKELGRGRANPMAVVEEIEGRDIRDTGSKILDAITGGPGTANGEKLTDNQKRGIGSDLTIKP